MPSTAPPQIDVVVPTLNEAGELGALLDGLRAQHDTPLHIVVADGGSEDATPALAAAAGARTVVTAPGRGRQMNAGAAAGNAPLLLFLHADSRLEAGTRLARAVAALHHAERGGTPAAGHFPLRFRGGGRRRFYRYLQAKTRLNRPETWNGDQGLLIRRAWFEALGGFDERLPFLEDQRLGDAIRAHGRFITLPGTLSTSARRFASEGEAERYLLMTLIMCARRAGLADFFERASGLYRQQAHTGRLDLLPLLDLFAEIADARPGAWQALADYGYANLWQPCLALDLALGTRLLDWHDRTLAGRLDGPLARRGGAALLRRVALPALRRFAGRGPTA